MRIHAHLTVELGDSTGRLLGRLQKSLRSEGISVRVSTPCSILSCRMATEASPVPDVEGVSLRRGYQDSIRLLTRVAHLL